MNFGFSDGSFERSSNWVSRSPVDVDYFNRDRVIVRSVLKDHAVMHRIGERALVKRGGIIIRSDD